MGFGLNPDPISQKKARVLIKGQISIGKTPVLLFFIGAAIYIPIIKLIFLLLFYLRGVILLTMKRFTISFSNMGGLPSSPDIKTDSPKIEGEIEKAIRHHACYTVSIYDNKNKRDIGYAGALQPQKLQRLFASADTIGANKNVVNFNQSEHHNTISQILNSKA